MGFAGHDAMSVVDKTIVDQSFEVKLRLLSYLRVFRVRIVLNDQSLLGNFIRIPHHGEFVVVSPENHLVGKAAKPED